MTDSLIFYRVELTPMPGGWHKRKPAHSKIVAPVDPTTRLLLRRAKKVMRETSVKGHTQVNNDGSVQFQPIGGGYVMTISPEGSTNA